MPSPFPGMDPYLEPPLLWPDVRHELISQIRSALNPRLRPQYVVRVELRVYLSHEDDPGRRAIVPDRSGFGNKAKPKRGKLFAEAAISVAESIPLTALLDEQIEAARLEIRAVDTGDLVTIIEVHRVIASRHPSTYSKPADPPLRPGPAS